VCRAACRGLAVIAAAVLSVLAGGGCGGSSGSGGGAHSSTADHPGSVALFLDSRLVGDQWEVAVRAADATELYQAACRVAYNPAALQPVAARRGSLVDGRAAFFVKLDCAGYVPCAFTYHLGEGTPAGEGEIVRLAFRIVDPRGDPGLALVSDPLFLIARDASGVNLSLEAAR